MSSKDSVRVLIIAIIIVVLGCVYSCTGSIGQKNSGEPDDTKQVQLADGSKLAEDVFGKWVEVKPIDDPGNPYIDEYQTWDVWAWENLLTVPFVRKAPDEQPANYICLRFRIDSNGYMMPFMDDMHAFERSRIDGTGSEYRLGLTRVRAEGEIDPELRQSLYDAGFVIQASYYREIPAWLAEDPPLRAMLLPNGEVLTDGLLGEKAKSEGCCGGKGSVFARYSADGELIHAKSSANWWYLFYDAANKGKPDGVLVNTNCGYIKFVDEQSNELLSVWDYDGTELPAVEPAQRDPHPFIWLEAKTIQTYYRVTHVIE